MKFAFVNMLSNYLNFEFCWIMMSLFIQQVDLREITLYPINGVFMTLAFAVCRVLIFPYMYYVCGKINGISIWEVPSMIPKKCTISCAFLIAIQLYWLSVMVRGVLSFFGNKGSEARKKRWSQRRVSSCFQFSTCWALMEKTRCYKALL